MLLTLHNRVHSVINCVKFRQLIIISQFGIFTFRDKNSHTQKMITQYVICFTKLNTIYCICTVQYAYSLFLLTNYRVKVSRSKVVSFFFIDDIFYVVIVFKIHEIIYLRKRQYITGDIL
jgi:hypothetical protein